MSAKTQGDIGLLDKEDVRKSPPPKMYNVILNNDDFTTMEFVTGILTDIFNRNLEQAVAIMLIVHKSGKGVAGTYTKDIAVTKMQQATERARREEHPLQLTIEPQ